MHLKVFFLNPKSSLLLLLFLVFAHAQGVAQNNYTVFKTTGQVMQYSSGSWVLLKSKDRISAETRIKCEANASFLVFDAQYVVYDVKKSGEYILKNGLVNQNGSKNEELQKAVQFFVQQTFASGSKNVSQKSKGSVERGRTGSIFPWDSTLYIRDTVTFKVQLPKTEYPVQVKIRNGNQETRFLAYHDTIIQMIASNFENAAWNRFSVGKQTFAFSVDRVIPIIVAPYLSTILEGKANALQFYIALEGCTSWKLLEEVDRILTKANDLPADEKARLKELLKGTIYEESL